MENRDVIECINGNTIHHGKESNRIYLLEKRKDCIKNIADELEILANINEYEKIILKCEEKDREYCLENGYIEEAEIPRFFNGRKKCYIMSKFINKQRENSSQLEQIIEVLFKAKAKPIREAKQMDKGYDIRILEEEHIENMTKIYREVFASYPFPIYDSKYILNTMQENVVYFGVFYESELAGIASCEISDKYNNAEMTDFAILNIHRGRGLAKAMLKEMEAEMQRRDIKTLYTIARALSLAMNCTFSESGYLFGGTLINNTQISGGIESMNVWHKNL